jgi:hypothetical protein
MESAIIIIIIISKSSFPHIPYNYTSALEALK